MYNRYAKKRGINFTALLILELLYDAHHDSTATPYTQKALCEQLLLPKQLVNGFINNFREDGYIELTEARDRRNKIIRLTDAGLAYVNTANAPMDAAEESAWETFSDEEIATFTAALEKYRQAIQVALGDCP